MKKRILSVFISAALLLSVAPSVYAADRAQLEISLNGTTVNASAVIQDGTLYIPIRTVCEKLGDTVTYSSSAGKAVVSISGDSGTIEVNLSDDSLKSSEHSRYLSYGAAGQCGVFDSKAYLSANLFAEYFNLKSVYDQTSNAVYLTSFIPNNLAINTVTKAGETASLKTTIQYPKISGLHDSAVQDKINAVLQKDAEAAESDGKTNAAELIKDNIPSKCETYFNYSVSYNQNGLLCIVLTDYQYLGGAHGGTIQTARTFNLATGAELSLVDLMQSGKDYTSYLNGVVRKGIDSRELYELNKFTDIGEKPEFYLTPDGIFIYFQQYAYFPYASGIQEFIASYDDLKTYLKPEYRFLYEEATELQKGENTLNVGGTAKVTLDGNPTTGYDWYYTVEGDGILSPAGTQYVRSSNLTGAGGTYTWLFKADKAGTTTITFKYYRSWEGKSTATAENTITYTVTVK